MSSYIYKVKKNLIGKTILDIKADKCCFKKGDIIYIANLDDKIHSRWLYYRENNGIIRLTKIPERTISLDYKSEFNIDSTKKITLLDDNTSEMIEKYFIHNINIFPFYDVKTQDDYLNNVISNFRKEDYNLELYIDVKTNYLKTNLFENYNLVISNRYGVIVFKTIDEDLFTSKELFDEFKSELNRTDPIYSSLLNSSLISEDGNKLNIGYKKYYIFESEKSEDYYNRVNQNLSQIGYEDQMVCNLKMFLELLKNKIAQENEIIINDDKHFGILQILMPQYINSKTVNVNNEKLKFVPDQSYELDENQKDVLAQINRRSFLKAAAGSGKTILLLAKAYEVAASNPKKLFMILCYNNKLADDIRIQAVNTGKIRANLKILTLDKFIYDEVTQYDTGNPNDDFVVRRKIFVEKVRSGKFQKKFGGIFIDEMQQLMVDGECIAALLECLDDEKYMILAGDYYQQIRTDVNYESDDDEIIDEADNNTFYIGNYDFQKIIMEKNYRNSEEITKTINKMLIRIKTFMTELEIPFDFEEKNILLGKTTRKGNDIPRYYNVSNEDEMINVIIKELKQLLLVNKYAQSEILLLSPKGMGERDKKQHHNIYMLEQKIKSSGIKVCNFGKGDSLQAEGIRMGTIGKAIGLDFKAVIIYGTNMFAKTNKEYYRIGTMRDLKLQNKTTKKEFIKYLKDIYVACSRARDTLIVVDDLKGGNLITEFLKLVGEESERNK